MKTSAVATFIILWLVGYGAAFFGLGIIIGSHLK
jgi:hypothetical protein